MAPRARERLHLPSGAVVSVEADGPRSSSTRTGTLAVLDAFAQGQLRLRGQGGEKVTAGSLRMDDFQVLRAYLTARGVASEPPVKRGCGNCGEPVEARPCERLELGPFLDGELVHPELDAPFSFGEPLAVEGLGEVVLRSVTADEARPLLRALEAPVLRLTGAAVRALGVVRLDGDEHPGRIARKLQRATDAQWSGLTDLIDQAWYPPRLQAWVRCEACGARNAFEAPASKEFPPGEGPAGEPDEPFLAFEAFAARVERHADAIFKRRGASGVGLFVDDGVADCDEGGVPLLGCYEPAEEEGHGQAGRPPEVRLYYRTFKAMHDEEGPYDVDAEIRETLDHELDHHEAFLRGYDPQDELERSEIADEERSMVGGTETLRRASRQVRSSLGDFFYRTWPLWLLVLLAALGEALSSGR